MNRKIVVPLDGSELAECVLPHVENLATGSQIPTIVFVAVLESFTHITYESSFGEDHWEQMEAETRAYLEKYLAQVKSRLNLGGANVQTAVLSGKTADALVDYAEKIGLKNLV